MKRILIITILCLFVISMSVVAFAAEPVNSQENTYKKVAIIPYINSTEEKKGYVKEIIDSKYTELYSNKNFQMIPEVDVLKALNSTGFSIANMELPEKDILAAVAKETNADYVIAMEVSQLITTRHMSFFQTKVVTKTKLRYKFYNTEQSKMVLFSSLDSKTPLLYNKTYIHG